MKWKLPPKTKVIYEALGCIADRRIEINGDNAKVYSSSKNKFYEVKYDSGKKAIIANDNASYWRGYLGYPSVAFLMLKGIIKYNSKFNEALKGIVWKDLNAKFNKDFAKSTEYVNDILKERGFSIEEVEDEVDLIYAQIVSLDLDVLEPKIIPPKGY